MKHIVLLCDGMSDLPCDELNGKTPMTVACKPNMDALAESAEVGLAKTVPESLPAGSDVANMSVLGYDPLKYYTGRSPFEAASMGIEMSPDDTAVRVNLVRLSEAERFEDAVMLSYCADDIHTCEAAEVIKLVDSEFGNDSMKFYPGNSYRHCLIWHNAVEPLNMTPPHDITGQRIGDYLKGANQEAVELMRKSHELLRGRQSNCIWLWGEGKKAALPAFREEFGLNGCMISAVDLLKGIGRIAKMNVIEVEGATGYIDTNFDGKATAAIDSLKSGADLVYIHIEAPDECAHRGEVANKIKSIELIDELVLGKLLKELRGERFKILITPDHPTPLCLKTHTHEPVPFLIYDSEVSNSNKGVETFNEENASKTGVYVEHGYELMRRFIDAR